MCPLPLCSNDSQTFEKKNSRRNTEDTDRNTDNTEETQRKITRKKLQLENMILLF